jgi:hypothetical protein
MLGKRKMKTLIKICLTVFSFLIITFADMLASGGALGISALLILLCMSSFLMAENNCGSSQVKQPVPPFKILFNNDTTNTLSCISPYHKKGQPFSDTILQGTVDETIGTGIDVHLISPSMGWTPWRPSKVYPIAVHAKWLKDTYNKGLNSYERYTFNGGDTIKTFVDRCHDKGIKAFISYRMNDGHHIHILKNKKYLNSQHAEVERATAICKFYTENPQYILGPDPFVKEHAYMAALLQNWIHPEVRRYKYNLIEEICENYDIDGLELDFMRHPHFFRLDMTTRQQRVDIMTEYIKSIREVLDQTERNGRYRWLSVRVPFRIRDADRIGIDFPAIVDAGVDMVNLSCNFVTEQQHDLARIKQMIPATPVYLELTHVSNFFSWSDKPGNIWRLTSDQEFYTAAHLAYARGADGISAFNFVYYRKTNESIIENISEPPFYVFEKLRDKQWLAKQPQLYFLNRYDSHYVRVTKRPFDVGQKKQFTMDMAPPAGGWTTEGRLRFQFLSEINNSQWQVRFNGSELVKNPDVSEPYENPYTDGLGNENTLLAWTVPVDIVKDGINVLDVKVVSGKPPEIIHVDLAIK